MFSVLFGLSMDYLVYLVSRIQEEWHQLHHPPAAHGLAALDGRARPAQPPGHHRGPGQQRADHRGRGQHHDPGLRVVPARRPPDPRRSSASRSRFSVLVDALIIRGLLVPALMHLIGPANWALPAWLDRVLPRLALESTEHGRGAAPGDGKEPATLSQGG